MIETVEDDRVLTIPKVVAVVRDCLFKEEELVPSDVEPERKTVPLEHIAVEGVVTSFAFHPERLAKHKEEIRAFLNELPDEFHVHGGGGYTFLHACNDKHGVQWGEHRYMDMLFCLGMASGFVRWCLPREEWSVFPSGLPYVMVEARGVGFTKEGEVADGGSER